MEPESVVLFDGVCNLCCRSVQFIIRNDPTAQFKFCSLQSDAAVELLAGRSVTPSTSDTVLLLEHGKLYSHSEAALRIARRLTAPWKLFVCLRIVPVPIRDLVYRLIAANRYRMFGKRTSCMMPSPEVNARFVEFARPTEAGAADLPPNPVQ